MIKFYNFNEFRKNVKNKSTFIYKLIIYVPAMIE